MKWNGNFWLVLLCTWLIISCDSEEQVSYPNTANYNIIPKPQNLDSLDGFFHLNKNVKLYYPTALQSECVEFQSFIKENTELNLRPTKSLENDRIITITLWEKSPYEHYTLEVTKNKITL